MASAQGLNPNAPEFIFAPQIGYLGNSTPLPVAPVDNPYIFYCSESILISREYFPFQSTSCCATYSFPFPTHFGESLLLLPTTHESAVHDQPRLVELLPGQDEEEAHDVVADEAATADQKIMPAPRVARDRRTNYKGGLRNKYHRWFDGKMERGHGSSRTSTSSQRRQEWKPAALKSVKNDGNWNNMRKSTSTFRRSFVKKRFFEVMPIAKDGEGTTVMIRNIPNKYSRDLLMSFLDNHCAKENWKAAEGGDESESAFDFLYLPIDFWTGMNKGYAFVNFTNPKAVWKFYLAAHYQTWDAFQSTKIREIAYARIQGKKDLVDHFDTMWFPCDWEDVLPVCFTPPRDGSEKAVEKTLIGRLEGWNGTAVIGPSHRVRHTYTASKRSA